jgi:hypothetical protein
VSEATSGNGPAGALATGGARFRLALRWCLLAAVASAALEVLASGFTTRLALGVGLVPYALAAAASHAALVGLVASTLGAAFAFLGARDPAVAVARAIASTLFAASAVFFWSGAATLRAEGSDLGAVVFAAFPAVALAFTYFATRWLARRVVAGEGEPPLLPGAVGLLVLSVPASWLASELRQPSGLPEARMDLVLITVDGLSEGEQGPEWGAFAAEGVAFRQAVSPTPHATRAAHASMLLGLHPLRSGVISDDDVLGRGYRSVFESFAEEGWATGAFLSDARLAAGCGLEQGLGTWDDGFLSDWRRPWLVRRVLPPVGWRPADGTVDAFAAWLEPRKARPFAAWLHFSDPVHSAQGALAVDAAIGRVRTLLADARVLDHTVVVLVGAHGASVAEPVDGLGDGIVHVPLAVRLTAPLQKPEIDAQVRLLDVANTLLDALRFRVMEESEGVALVAYGTGLRKATMSATLLGRSREGEWFLGVRNNGVKYLALPDGSERMYDLAADPGETTDIAADQPQTSKAARSIVNLERAALDRLLRDR